MLLLVSGSLPFVHAHTTADVERYSIEVGWKIEPPIVSHRNAVVFAVTEAGADGQGATVGVKGAFKNLDAVIKFGGATKQLDINTDARPGHYFSDIVPTRTGTYSVEITGDLNGVPVSVDIPIENIESTAILDFPPRSSGGSEDLGPIKNALAELRQDVTDLQMDGGSGGGPPAQDGGSAYDWAVFGLSMGAAGVILAIISMIKRR